MSGHDFVPDPKGRDRNCQQCGSAYHCGACNEGSGMMGHYVRDDDGYFYTCQDPERAARHRADLLARFRKANRTPPRRRRR